MKRAFSILLALCLILSLLPAGTFAADIVSSGSCGDNLTWTLDSDGLLTISGTGTMLNYDWADSPFFSKSDSIRSLVIEPGVTTIGTTAFYYCRSLTSVEIPDSVTSIGSNAFYVCSSLTSVEIPASVATIGSSAFLNCSSLTSVVIPAGVTNINYETFSGCSSLISVEIPDSVTSIDSYAFSGCSRLTSVKIPDSVTSIDSYAFSGCSSLTSFEIPDSVTSIGNYAFQNCTNMTNLAIPDSVSSIGSYAFQNCTSLTSVAIPDSVISIGDFAFSDCIGLTSIEIPDSVTSIGSGAFFNCSSLASITIPDSVMSIGGSAFSSCSSLTSVEIPESVTRIENSAFSDCYSLTSMLIPDGVTSIESYAFSGCSSLANVTLPCNLSSLGYNAFAGCSSLTSVTIPSSLKSLSGGAFSDCIALTEVSGFENRSVPEDCFSGCTNLTLVTVGGSVGSNAFSGCTALTSVTVGGNLGEYAFNDCTSLVRVTMTDGSSIGTYALGNCSALTTVDLPTTLCTVEANAFRNDTALTDVHYAGTQKQWNAITIRTSGNDPLVNASIHMACQHAETELRNYREATCTETGYTGDYVCKVCGETIATGSEIDALGHEWSEWKVTIAPTETEVGYEARTCSVCGEHETREVPVLAHVHSLTAVAAVPSTCETAGTEAYWKCAGCGKLFADADAKTEIEAPVVVAALGHDWDDLVVTKAATCTEEGVMTFTCKHDASHTRTEAIAKIPHTWGDWVVTKAATETEEGVETRTCSICGATETREIPVLAHVHNLTAISAVPAGCETAGTEAYWKCSGCGKLFSDTEGKNEIEAPVVITARGHDVEVKNAKAATCTETGYTGDEVCKFCGKVVKQSEVIPARGHRWGKWAVIISSTETSEGVEIHTCTVCGEIESRTIPALPHVHVLTMVEAKAPTCAEDGYEAHWQCSGCGKIFADAEGMTELNAPVAIPALPHTWGDWVTAIPATDSETGVEVRVCRVCQAIETRAIPKTCPFKDVPAGAYYRDPVLWAYSHEPQITSGYDDGSFRPDQVCTRAQVVTFLWRAAGEPEPKLKLNPFRDVSESAYYYKAVLWALENGVTTGNSASTFNPNGECTRAQVVTFLWRAAGEPEPASTTNPFRDVSSSAYYYKAVLWALENGITTGNTSTTFNPNGKCTRAHVVTFLYRANT